MAEIVSLDELQQTPHAEVFERREPRTVRLELAADERIPAHNHPGMDIVLVVLSGTVELTLDDEPHELGANDVARFSGQRDISPYAVEPSTALVVFAPAD